MDLTHWDCPEPDDNDALNLDNYEFGIKIDIVEERRSQEHHFHPSIVKALALALALALCFCVLKCLIRYDVSPSFRDDFKPKGLCRRCYTLAEVIEAIQHVSANIETEMLSFLKLRFK